jgi:UDP-glucose 4-epimerase
MRKALVTGGLGFIGYHLCEKLLNEGIEVIAVDNCEKANKKSIQEEMLLSIGRNANFKYMNKRFGNVVSSSLLEGLDCVFHLASPFITRSWNNFAHIIYSHLAETKALTAACKSKNIPLVYTSSIEVYGPRFGIVTEKASMSPISKLGILKTAVEALLHEEVRRNEKGLCILRLPTVYGPWQGEEGTYHQLILTQIRGEMSKVVEDSCKVDIVYIDDVVEALWRAGNNKTLFGTYNVGSGEKDQWKKGVELLSNDYSRLLLQEPLPMEISINKFKKQFNYSPSTSLQAGLSKHKKHIEQMEKLKKFYN